MRKVKKQSGFTLVEIAIVLVIIGLLLAGVLKGQELIESSRIKGMAKDLNSFSAIVTSYQDRYRGLPGDDLTITTHTERGWGATAFTASTVNSLIGAPTAITTAASLLALAGTTENVMAMQALRYAGFLEGDGSKATPPPSNAAGGFIGFTNTVMGFGSVNVVCFTGLNGKQAGALDRLLDDGDNTKGSVRAVVTTVAATVPTAAAYVEATPDFILCKTL